MVFALQHRYLGSREGLHREKQADETLSPRMVTTQPKLVVFSGGTGGNALVSAFQAISNRISYVLPISDNGGSTSEILRVLGGIGVGDLRSRLVRLIPDADEGTDRYAIKQLLSHRLPVDREKARAEWLDIVEGEGVLWHAIQNHEKSQAIRSFLLVMNAELVKRARPGSSFNFSTGAVGNLFLTGMRLFFGSIETAIFMFASITGIDPCTEVLPIFNTSYMTPIAALLRNDDVIAGQNSISHPSAFSAITPAAESATDDHEDANLPGSLASLRRAEIMYDKSIDEPLPARIKEIYYINPYGQRMAPSTNVRVLKALQDAEAIIYSPGSLYTSIVPLIIPQSVGRAIVASNKKKIFFLNGSLDRETPNYCAADFMDALANAASADRWDEVCTHLIYIRGPGVPFVDEERFRRENIQVIHTSGARAGSGMAYVPETVYLILSALLVKHAPVRRSTVNYHNSGKVA